MRLADKPGLAALVAPLAPATFLDQHWRVRPLHVESDVERVLQLLGVPELRDFASLERVWRQDALALPPTGGDEYLGATIPASAIRTLYECGLPMFLPRPERQFPSLSTWLDRLRFDLGIPAASKLVASMHATRGRTTTGAHFDQAATFVVQLEGTKTWWVAPNHSAPFPTERHSIAMARPHPDLHDQLIAPLPVAMPSDAEEIVLRPGSILYLPSGWWHATQANEASLALMFIAINVSWADVVARTVRKRLVREPAWRRLAIGAGSTNARFHRQAFDELTPLLDELAAVVDELRAEEIIAPSFRRAPDATCRDEGGALRFVGATCEARVVLRGPELAVFRAIEQIDGVFTVADLAAAGHEHVHVTAVVTLLADVDYLAVL